MLTVIFRALSRIATGPMATAVVLFASGLASAQSNPVPFVNQPLVPSSVAPGGAGFTLTVNGAGFVQGSVVNWNGSPRTTTFVSTEKLTAAVLASDIAGPGTASVTVFNPAPGGGTSNAVFLPVAGSAGAVTFSGPELSGDTGSFGVVTGDFNRDGKLDFAANDFNHGAVLVFLGNGDGTFQPPVSYATASSPSSLVAADFNADGKLDLAAFAILNQRGGTFTVVSVLLGNGDGTFQPHHDYTIAVDFGFSYSNLVAGDFNRDGKLDLATIDVGSDLLEVLLGNGDGSFQPPVGSTVGGSQYFGLVVGDFNGDGKLDLATVDEAFQEILVLLGNGDGTFKAGVGYPAGGFAGVPAAADLNGDGILDLAVANSSGGSTVSVLLGNGDGTFKPYQQFATGSDPIVVVAADFNGDGKLDLIVNSGCDSDPNCGGNTPGTISVLLGNGDGTFQNHVDYPTGYQPAGLAAGDFNGDGKLDLVTTNGDNTISTLLQTTAILSQGDLAFGEQAAGTTSAAQTVTLTNTAASTLNLTSISVTGPDLGDFAQTNTCGTSLAAGASCTMSVTFTPTAEGTRNAFVSMADNALGSPQQVALIGTGVAPVVELLPPSLSFLTQLVGTTSAAQKALLVNVGNAALNITSITVSGDFLEQNNCGPSVAVGASCTITVQFRPKAENTRTGAVTITDNAANSPQTIPLTGQGTFFKVSPTSLSFGSEAVGVTSAAQIVTLTNVAKVAQNFPLPRIIGADPGDFAQTNTCGTSVPAGGSCTFSVTFTPAAKGSRSATLRVAGGGGGVKSVALTGTGT